jgi:hypothetical protein
MYVNDENHEKQEFSKKMEEVGIVMNAHDEHREKQEFSK